KDLLADLPLLLPSHLPLIVEIADQHPQPALLLNDRVLLPLELVARVVGYGQTRRRTQVRELFIDRGDLLVMLADPGAVELDQGLGILVPHLDGLLLAFGDGQLRREALRRPIVLQDRRLAHEDPGRAGAPLPTEPTAVEDLRGAGSLRTNGGSSGS